jgi:hypothetical protein
VTWHLPQIPLPPQTESRSTPKALAASSTVVPSGKDPRRPEGLNTTRQVREASASSAAVLTTTAPFAFGGRLPVGLDPGHAVGVVSVEHI